MHLCVLFSLWSNEDTKDPLRGSALHSFIVLDTKPLLLQDFCIIYITLDIKVQTQYCLQIVQ